jgi:hypothetical protein
MQLGNIHTQNNPTDILQASDDPPLFAVRSSSSMEVTSTSTSIRPQDKRPQITNMHSRGGTIARTPC